MSEQKIMFSVRKSAEGSYEARSGILFFTRADRKDCLRIHGWFDESEAFFADFRHRALLHRAEDIFLFEKIFGVSIANSEGKEIPVRYISEQHVKEVLGRIRRPKTGSPKIIPERWMYGQRLKV